MSKRKKTRRTSMAISHSPSAKANASLPAGKARRWRLSSNMLDFPPAPKFRPDDKPVHAAATSGNWWERRCSTSTGSRIRRRSFARLLEDERFYSKVGATPIGIPGRAERPIKTSPLRGIKDSPPYLHDGRLLTLEDTVAFFNIVLGAKVTAHDKAIRSSSCAPSKS